MSMRISPAHLGLNCRDPLAVERFYADYLGFSRARAIVGADGSPIVFIRNGDFMIELFRAGEASPLPPAEKDGYTFAGYRHVAFNVDSLDEVLAKMGQDARVSLGPISLDEESPGWKVVWLKDPEGNVVEISEGYADQ
jgi:glyoxylase I family protein